MPENRVSKPNPIDTHVGNRLRIRRMHLGLSQERLGDALGVTFQQIQKYEKGTNRVSASRLQEAARILDVPVSYFFEDAPHSNPSVTDSDGTALLAALDPASFRLLRALLAIDPKRRERIAGLLLPIIAEISKGSGLPLPAEAERE